MPKPKSSKSRVAKSVNKKSSFRFRWWMGLALVVLIAIIGVVVVRFSQAGGSRTFSVDAGTIQGGNGASAAPVQNGIGFVAYGNAMKGPAGSYAQSQESFGQISGLNSGNATIQVCFTFYLTNVGNDPFPTDYYVSILDWGGNEVAADHQTIYAQGTVRKCIQQNIGSPSGNNSFFYKMSAGNNLPHLVEISRTTLQTNSNNPAPNPTPAPTPGPAPPPQQQQCVNGSTGTVTCGFPAGTLVSTCGYRNVNGYALVCPQGNWNYIGTGDVDYNLARQRGATHEHDVGYWQLGNFCAVKSRITSDPRLDFQSPNHFYLVGCPPASAFKSTPGGWTQGRVTSPPTPKGRLYITKYGPNGPMPPDARFKSSPANTPGNTGVCVKNNENSTFACEGKNPWALDGLFVSGSPYRAYFTVPNNWKLTRVLVNKEQLSDPGTSVQVNIRQNATTYVDLYFDPR